MLSIWIMENRIFHLETKTSEIGIDCGDCGDFTARNIFLTSAVGSFSQKPDLQVIWGPQGSETVAGWFYTGPFRSSQEVNPCPIPRLINLFGKFSSRKSTYCLLPLNVKSWSVSIHCVNISGYFNNNYQNYWPAKWCKIYLQNIYIYIYRERERERERELRDIVLTSRLDDPIYPTPPLEQDMTQGHFFKFSRFEFRVFLLLGLAASPRLKNLVCPTIYP